MEKFDDLTKEWNQIAKQIRAYDKRYSYGTPLISDFGYDALKDRLMEIEQIIGKQKNSPLNTIGTISHEETIEHLEPMLSLDHGYGEASIQNFYKKMLNLLKTDVVPQMVIEHKIDGIATSIRYEHGQLKLVLTRGDGFRGLNITEHAKYIIGIPKYFPIENFEVRGEVYMKFADFNNLPNFKNPRNAVAGILRSKDLDIVSSHKLFFIAHGFTNRGTNSFTTYENGIIFLRQNGFEISDYYISDSEAESCRIFNTLDRNSIDYPIDGVVLKLNDLSLWDKLGSHSTAPRYAFATKFSPKDSETQIISIEMQVGKFGTITPVANIDSVEIDGITIQKVSMHNMQEFVNKNYLKGDKIIIARAGDVIPYILQKTSNNQIEKAELPTHCPSCNTKLIWDSVNLKCTNGWNCKAQALLRIEHFVSRKAFNINGLGSKNLEKLYDYQIIQKPNDVFKLTQLALNNDQLIKNLLGSKVVQNLYNQIEKNRIISLSKFIYALCIPNVGYGTSKLLAAHCVDFETFISTFSQDTQIKIKHVGQTILESIRHFLNTEQWIFDCYKEIKIQK
ncbi:MAG: NAD-dependent DNA ligase LigA [Alphaproteobacteria bacterium]|nr:MAG: NAD-dependent DNA ligase LigA [Alphaproteobacteria bacterium]